MNGLDWGIAPAIIEYFLLVLLFSLYPYMNARMVLFGVFLPETARDHKLVRRMRRRYTLIMWIIALAVAAAIVIWRSSVSTMDDGLLMIPAFCVPMILMPTLYMIFRKSALRLKQEQNWQVPVNTKRVASLSFPRKQLALSHTWYLAPLAIIFICAGIAAIRWDSIPHNLVTHYGADGTANGFSTKSVSIVFLLNFIQIGILAVFFLTNVFIRRSKQSLDPNNPEQSMIKQIKLRQLGSIFLWLLSLVSLSFMGVIQGSILYGWPSNVVTNVVIFFLLFIVAATIGFVVYVRHLKLDEQSDPMIENDTYWKAGAFYYNPSDPALFVSKRTGIGWTINFGQPISWVIMLGIVLIPVIALIIGSKP
jgi:uncharacterized membrane protein